MTQVEMKNGEIRYIAEKKDFVELVDEFMGYDCKKYAEELPEEDELDAAYEEVFRLESLMERKDEMRTSTIPPMSRFTHKKPDGGYSVEISRDWMKEFFDYEELGAIEDLKKLVDRDQEVCPVTDFIDGESVDFCQVCNHEVYEDDLFCASCGQRLKKGKEQ